MAHKLSQAEIDRTSSKTTMARGEYQIHLLIEATSGLTLQQRDSSVDVLITAKGFGVTEYSKIKENIGFEETYWGEHFFFTKSFSKSPLVQKQRLTIEVWDRNRVLSNALIGSYEIDVVRIYSEKDHSFIHRWLALSNIERQFDEITGYVKVSICVSGEGDKTIELNCEPITSIGTEKKVLMPPNIERKSYQLIVDIYQAQNVKPADGTTVDSFIGVEFGRIYKQTQIKRSTRDPLFNERLFIPMSLPTVTDHIIVRIIDFNLIQKAEVIGSHYININRLVKEISSKDDNSSVMSQNHKEYSKTQWINFYGPQLESNRKEQKTIHQFYPQLASYYVGSLLMKVSLEENSGPVLHKELISQKIKLLPPRYFRVTAIITAGMNLQDKGKKYSICVRVGQEQVNTEQSYCKNGFCMWGVQKTMTMTVYQNQEVPDIFVYLVNSSGEKVCFVRYKSIPLIVLDDKWVNLKPDLSKVDMKSEEAGYLKLGLSIESIPKKQSPTTKKINNSLSKIFEKERGGNGKIIIELISAESLVPLDQDGSCTPFFTFSYMQSEESSQVKQRTLNPVYFQKIIMDAEILDQESCPPIIVNAYDQDQRSKEFLGTTFIDIGDAIHDKSLTLNSGDENRAPTPKWFQLTQNGVSVGRFLASFCLRRNFVGFIPPTISIEKKKFRINLLIYGLRGMKSNGLFSVKKPFIEFDYESLNVYGESLGKNKQGRQIGVHNKNIITQPNESGASINIQMVNTTTIYLPQNPNYWPSLTATVKDLILGGLVEPTLGYFAVNLRAAYQQTRIMKRQIFDPKVQSIRDIILNKLYKKQSKVEKLKGINQRLLVSLRTFILKSINYNWSMVTTQTEFNSLKKFPNKKMISDSIVLFPRYIKGENNRYVEEHRELIQHNQEYIAIGYDSKEIREIPTLEKRRKHYRFYMDETYEHYYERVYGAKMGLSSEVDIRKGRVFFGEDTITNLLRKVTTEDVFAGKYKGNCYIDLHRELETQDDKKFNQHTKETMKKFMTTSKIKMFLYVIEAASLPTKDEFSLSDPYLIVRCGDQVIDLEEYAIEDESNPQFYRKIVIVVEFPRDSVLEIEVWDQDPLKIDELIGRATIDLENRILANSTGICGNNPIQTHQLTSEVSKRSQGIIRFWLDLVPLEQLSMYREMDISPKQESNFEIRVIVWAVNEMPINDFEGMTDLFVTCSFQDETQETDTHYRSASGDGTFNWRIIFKAKLPVKNPTLTFRVFDKDILTSDDYLTSGSFSIGKYLNEAWEGDFGRKLFLSEYDLSKYSSEPSSSFRIVDGQKLYDRFELDLICRKEDDFQVKTKGTIELSIEILPQEQAKRKPAGLGRDNPNQHPHLPEPKDRFAFSWNPITMLTRLLGRGFRYKIVCALVTTVIFFLIWNFGHSYIGAIFGNITTS